MGILRTAAQRHAAALVGSAPSACLGGSARPAVERGAAAVGDHAARAALRRASGACTAALIDGAAASARVTRHASPAAENLAASIRALAALDAAVGARFPL